MDLRWLALANGKIGLLAIPERPGLLSANALHYGTADLNAGADYVLKLPAATKKLFVAVSAGEAAQPCRAPSKR